MPTKFMVNIAEKVILLLIAGVCTWGMSSLQKISESTVSLNEKMGYVVEKLKSHDDELKEHEREIWELKLQK